MDEHIKELLVLSGIGLVTVVMAWYIFAPQPGKFGPDSYGTFDDPTCTQLPCPNRPNQGQAINQINPSQS